MFDTLVPPLSASGSFKFNAMGPLALGINVAVVLTLLIQHESILRVHRYIHLDSSRMHSLFQSYFVFALLFSLASIDLYHFKDQTRLPNTVASGCSLIITVAFIIKSYTSPNLDSLDYLEHRLLMAPDPAPLVSTTPSLSKTPIMAITRQSMKPQLDSKDISPLSCYSNTFTRLTPADSNFNHVKTPILATLLSAESVLAHQLGAMDTMSHWKTALPIIIAAFYIGSQLVYSLSMLKTNVYTRYRQLVLTNCLNIALSIMVLVSMATEKTNSSLIHFADMDVLNYFVSIWIVVQSMAVLLYHFKRRSSSKRSSIEVYDSINSP